LYNEKVEVKAPEAGVVTQLFAQLQAAIGVTNPTFDLILRSEHLPSKSIQMEKQLQLLPQPKLLRRKLMLLKRMPLKKLLLLRLKLRKKKPSQHQKLNVKYFILSEKSAKPSSAPAQVFGGNRAERRVSHIL
jgi:hypothetical protein